ncbi:MAG: Xaa-Pro peptidase family protein [Candidatus Omnitrophica bacterium]|nr:Xaa-Pro peptidase family protein [Candidatus Omnitrophota bacterium]
MNLRIKKFYQRLEKEHLDGFLVSSPANITYLTHYPSRDSYLIVSKKQNIYITDSRYFEEARSNLKGFIIIKQIKDSVFNLIVDCFRQLALKHVGFEERNLTFAEYEKIKEKLNPKITLIPTHSLIEDLRMVKDKNELDKIKKAIHITSLAFDFIYNLNLVGKSEIEIVAELQHFIRYNGADSHAFDIIVASGPNSSFPHHISSHKKIKKGEIVLIDMGVDYMGYKSDLTRVFFSDKITSFERNIYKIVLDSQRRAIDKIKTGILINKIDKVARQYITYRGYGGFFSHNLGHGIGLEVHEQPHISKSEEGELIEGMVFTVEPGIYLPGRFGIRIEDMVLVTKKGSEVLSGALHK